MSLFIPLLCQATITPIVMKFCINDISIPAFFTFYGCVWPSGTQRKNYNVIYLCHWSHWRHRKVFSTFKILFFQHPEHPSGECFCTALNLFRVSQLLVFRQNWHWLFTCHTQYKRQNKSSAKKYIYLQPSWGDIFVADCTL